MKETLSPRILDRELSRSGSGLRCGSYRKLYSDRQLITELDIVNELDGHSGCVNALCWSKSGSLLASGSDDQHLNIHSYQPSDTDRQFSLSTTVATGHTHNIFSVKFMPHSNDRTLITAAGDAEVRIFDLEYAGQARQASAPSSLASEGRRRGRNNLFNGVRYLNDGDTNCRVYRSHGDRVKRIVTESSPYLFLTCSEDGEVRQWDLRQPSCAYPRPRGARFGSSHGSDDNGVPPPLISYKQYNLDLNTISCAASQPHYIALGGAHLHCFLHDRRMTGRDLLVEAGRTLPPANRMSDGEEELMGQATQCVRKFAPNGQSRMRRTDNGHITACKISDARPDEMIVSWSGDHIYSFDLVRSPGIEEAKITPAVGDLGGKRVKESEIRKRKRKTDGSQSSLTQDNAARASLRQRTEEARQGHDTALRIRYRNGQQEDIPLPLDDDEVEQQQAGLLTEEQGEARRLARVTVKIRSFLFGPPEESSDPTARYTSALSHAASVIADMEQAMRDWGYPLDPSSEEVVVRQTLRRNRESARNFIQASGTLARALGGKLRTPFGESPLMAHFVQIDPKSVDPAMSQREEFGYAFLKAILLWIDSGVGRLIEGFTRPNELQASSRAGARLPIPESEATPEAIDEHLIPYLVRLASDRAIVDIDTNRFELDGSRQIFPTETAAVLAFAAIVKIPFADLSSAVATAEGSESIQAQDRSTAIKYWASKVGRGVLMNAAEGVNFTFVDRAFGGLGRVLSGIVEEEDALRSISDEEEEAVQNVTLVDHAISGERQIHTASSEVIATLAQQLDQDDDQEDSSTEESSHEDEEMEHDYDDDSDSEQTDEESSDPDEEDGVPNTGLPRFVYRSAFERRHMRERVEADTLCSPHSRVYRGHCNVKTVKDVNYFGLNDEYVVSGSDDGNFFIWERKTSELVNVLEGDGEVVNVIQGHPYETMLAASGIDHTIKIFSPDSRARTVARLGLGVSAQDASGFSSLAWPPRLGRRRVQRRNDTQQTSTPTTSSEPAVAVSTSEPEDDESYVAPGGLTSRRRMRDAYRIMNQNDVERRGGNQDAFITTSMLAQMAQRLRVQRASRATQGGAEGAAPIGIEVEETGDDGVPVRIVLGEDCAMQ